MARKQATYLEIDPAKAKASTVDKIEAMLGDKDIDLERKLDGWRFLTHIGSRLDRVYMTGRRVSKKTGKLSEKGLCVPGLWPEPKRIRSLGYTVLDGEIMPPRKASFRDLAGIMNVDPKKAALRVAEIGLPRYYVFDVLFADGVDVRKKPLRERRKIRDKILAQLYPRSKLVRPLKSLYNNFGRPIATNEDKRSYYEREVESGGEGVITKRLTSFYGDGWTKWKKYSTLDCVITGYTEATHGITGKYAGLIGAVKISVYKGKKLVEVGQVSGMTDEMRVAISKKPRKYLYSVLEVRAQEMAKDRLRHPRWGRLRPDADHKSCTWTKLLSDLKASAKKKVSV